MGICSRLRVTVYAMQNYGDAYCVLFLLEGAGGFGGSSVFPSLMGLTLAFFGLESACEVFGHLPPHHTGTASDIVPGLAGEICFPDCEKLHPALRDPVSSIYSINICVACLSSLVRTVARSWFCMALGLVHNQVPRAWHFCINCIFYFIKKCANCQYE